MVIVHSVHIVYIYILRIKQKSNVYKRNAKLQKYMSCKEGLYTKNMVSYVWNVQDILKVVFVNCIVDSPGENTNSFAMILLRVKPTVSKNSWG